MNFKNCSKYIFSYILGMLVALLLSACGALCAYSLTTAILGLQ